MTETGRLEGELIHSRFDKILAISIIFGHIYIGKWQAATYNVYRKIKKKKRENVHN